jgi:hypothetical protein
MAQYLLTIISRKRKKQMNQRMDRSRLLIGAYCLQPYAGSETHVRDIAACHIDFIVAVDRGMEDTLDAFATYGVGAIVNGAIPGWCSCGQNGDMALHNPLEDYRTAAERFRDHPAIWGINVADEPCLADFAHCGRIMDLVAHAFPHQFAFLNLCPSYGVLPTNGEEEIFAQLGTASFEDYLTQACETIPADYLCYDFYQYTFPDTAVGIAQALKDLRIASDVARRYGKSLWIVLQVNSHLPDARISEQQLRYQAFSAMAFGVEAVLWACYTGGWYYHNVLDEKGEKTQQYDRLQAVNAAIHALGEPYMRYRTVATCGVGFDSETSPVPTSDSFTNACFCSVKEEGGKPLLVGDMIARRKGDSSRALFLCAAADPLGARAEVSRLVFGVAEGWRVSAYGGNGAISLTPSEDRFYRLAIPDGDGILLVAEPCAV